MTYTKYTSDATEALIYTQSTGVYAPGNGAIKNYDGTFPTPTPYDIEIRDFCETYQGAVWTIEDAYRENKDCATRELANAPNHLEFFQGYYKNLTLAQQVAQTNISENAVGYNAAIDASIAFLKTEEARLKKCYANPTTPWSFEFPRKLSTTR